MNGSKLVKREFLAGFQGDDGCKIRYDNWKDYIIMKIYEIEIYVNSLNFCEFVWFL